MKKELQNQNKQSVDHLEGFQIKAEQILSQTANKALDTTKIMSGLQDIYRALHRQTKTA
jgi:hypothetical protein